MSSSPGQGRNRQSVNRSAQVFGCRCLSRSRQFIPPDQSILAVGRFSISVVNPHSLEHDMIPSPEVRNRIDELATRAR